MYEQIFNYVHKDVNMFTFSDIEKERLQRPCTPSFLYGNPVWFGVLWLYFSRS